MTLSETIAVLAAVEAVEARYRDELDRVDRELGAAAAEAQALLLTDRPAADAIARLTGIATRSRELFAAIKAEKLEAAKKALASAE